VNPLPSAVFLDRDGTIIEDTHYLSRADQVRLIEGAAEAIARVNTLFIPVIVVTNQSGIGRGLLTAEDHQAITARLDDLLNEQGAHIDRSYFCPHMPGDGCECRKPGTLLYRNAAKDFPEIDLSRALYIGDKLRDAEPALELGGTGVLIPSSETTAAEIEAAGIKLRVGRSLGGVLDWYLCTN